MDEAECRSLLAAAQVARLATVDAGGVPHLVPVTFAAADDVVYTAVDAKPKRSPTLKRVDNIRATGRACLLADHYSEDWSHLWWVRADARADVLPDSSVEAMAALEVLAEKYPQHQRYPLVGPVLRLRVHRWAGWRAG